MNIDTLFPKQAFHNAVFSLATQSWLNTNNITKQMQFEKQYTNDTP